MSSFASVREGAVPGAGPHRHRRPLFAGAHPPKRQNDRISGLAEWRGCRSPPSGLESGSGSARERCRAVITTLAWLAIAHAVAFVINVFPAFMPATRVVPAFFYAHHNLPRVLLTAGGALFSSTGHLILALAPRRCGRKIMRAKKRTEIDTPGRWLDEQPSWRVPPAASFGSLGLTPSNQLFIAAGLTRTRLLPVVVGFFAGRIISYVVSALAVSRVANSIASILRDSWNSPRAWGIQLLSLAARVAVTMIPWTKRLHISVPAATGQVPVNGQSSRDPRLRPHHSISGLDPVELALWWVCGRASGATVMMVDCS